MATNVRRRTAASLVVLGGLLAACSSSTIGDPKPLTIDVTAEASTVAAGTKLAVSYEATGTYLSGVILQYGDGLYDSIPLYGAQAANGRLQHTWQEAGEFVVRGEAIDPTQGSAKDQVTVTVTGGGS